VLGLLLVAVSLGASNFAAAIGLGMGGVDNRARLRVALVFGLFEAAMPLIGLAIGQRVANRLGSATNEVGAALLVAVGIYTIIVAVRDDAGTARSVDRGGRLVVTGLALSIDNLVVGFALAALDVAFAAVAAVVATVSVTMSLIGLELGNRLGARTGRRSELIGGGVLVAVGIALAAGLFG
jgi:putative Mn2+ efflux pump MntP